MKPTKAVLFDLDGTLLDTAADLGTALNHVLREEGLPPLPQSSIRSSAGNGCRGLLKLGLQLAESDPRYPQLCARLLKWYEKSMLEQTELFEGMAETLCYLEQEKIRWGIVTNKPERYTHPLMQHLGLDVRAYCIISGDTLPFRKPHPAPILHACQLLASKPEEAIYIGDMKTDVEASRLAGVPSITALYGYIPAGERPEEWQADGYLHHPTDLIAWLRTPAENPDQKAP